VAYQKALNNRTFYRPPNVDAAAFEEHIFIVPYLPDGTLDPTRKAKLKLDMREDSKLRITQGPYTGAIGEVVGQQKEGHYKTRFLVTVKGKFKNPWPMVLGLWWIEAAVTGSVPMLPIIPVTE